MPYYNGLLMRDSLSDTGVVPSPGYFCMSPDIICHSQVADPKTFFQGNYGSDPNEAVQLGSHVNFIYTRAKNLSSSAISGWYILVYRSKSSLFMNPSIWKDNKLKTAGGQSYVTLDSVQPDQIVVANDYLILDGLSSNLFCVVGITSSSTDPALPPDFSTYSAFVNWIHQNQNICVRNLCLCRSFPDRQYERLDFFENPEDHDVLVAIKVSATDNLPSGTTFGVQCDPMGINKSQTVDQGRILTASGMCPEGFQGNVLTYGSLPSGSTWPSGGGLLTEIYVGREENDIAAQYAVDWDSFPIKPHELTGLSSNGILIRVGDCSTEFIS